MSCPGTGGGRGGMGGMGGGGAGAFSSELRRSPSVVVNPCFKKLWTTRFT